MSKANTEPPQAELLEEENVLDVNWRQEVSPLTYSITSYGADFDVDGIVRRLDNEDIVIPSFEPEVETASGIVGFQRHFVWSKAHLSFVVFGGDGWLS